MKNHHFSEVPLDTGLQFFCKINAIHTICISNVFLKFLEIVGTIINLTLEILESGWYNIHIGGTRMAKGKQLEKPPYPAVQVPI